VERQSPARPRASAGPLSLVGWYLMLPPLQFVGPASDPYSLAIVDSAAPLSRWLPMMTFKTLQECDNFSPHLARNLRKSVNTERDKKDVETLIGDLARQISVCRNRRPAPQGKIAVTGQEALREYVWLLRSR
jgi:hypothetical protein